MKALAMKRRTVLRGGLSLFGSSALLAACGESSRANGAEVHLPGKFEIEYSKAEWKRRLGEERFYILRESGTERPGSSPLNSEKRTGTFVCAGCTLPVYRSEDKYDSGTGWPSFTRAISGNVGTQPDNSLFMKRTEVHCRRCGGHLGHVFNDGPPPTGKRHCINGIAMRFEAGAA